LNDDGFPAGVVTFDRIGRHFFVQGDEGKTQTVYDAETLAAVGSFAARDRPWEPSFSPDGNWAMFCQRGEQWKPDWMPERAADWIERQLHLADSIICIVRLTDGKIVRRLSGRTSPSFTTDGSVWTVTEAGRTDDAVMLLAERWSPESPSPPWWLLLCSFAGVIAVAWDWRRGNSSHMNTNVGTANKVPVFLHIQPVTIFHAKSAARESSQPVP
jgi:hypothetical protein